MNEKAILKKYNRLPEWLRWILCWPISSFISVILWIIYDSIGQNIGAFNFVLKILHPVMVQVLFLFVFYYTVPRAKLTFIKIFIGLRTIILITFILGAVGVLTGLLKQECAPFDWNWWQEFLGEIFTLIFSLKIFKFIRDEKT